MLNNTNSPYIYWKFFCVLWFKWLWELLPKFFFCKIIRLNIRHMLVPAWPHSVIIYPFEIKTNPLKYAKFFWGCFLFYLIVKLLSLIYLLIRYFLSIPRLRWIFLLSRWILFIINMYDNMILLLIKMRATLFRGFFLFLLFFNLKNFSWICCIVHNLIIFHFPQFYIIIISILKKKKIIN